MQEFPNRLAEHDLQTENAYMRAKLQRVEEKRDIPKRGH